MLFFVSLPWNSSSFSFTSVFVFVCFSKSVSKSVVSSFQPQEVQLFGPDAACKSFFLAGLRPSWVSSYWNQATAKLILLVMSFRDISIIINEIIWQNVRGDVFQLFIEGAEGPEFLQLINLSGLWQHKVDDHITWRGKWKTLLIELTVITQLLFCGQFKRIPSTFFSPKSMHIQSSVSFPSILACGSPSVFRNLYLSKK